MSRSAMAVALLASALAFAWQALTVHFNYKGNWSALFCTGSEIRVPPSVATDDLYVFQNSTGYDGQFCRFIAHDPFLRRDTPNYLDDARLRYGRILVPLLAWMLAGGQHRAVDAAYHAVILLFVFLGAWWLARYAAMRGAAPAWGLAFLLVPAAMICLDRQTVDIALASLTMGFLIYIDTDERWKVFLVLAGAMLARETGVVLVGAWCLSLLLKKRAGAAVAFGTAVAPALGWYSYVASRTPQSKLLVSVMSVDSEHVVSLAKWLTPLTYPFPAPIVWTATVFDYVSLAAIPLAMVLSVRAISKQWAGAAELATLLFALAAIWFLFVFDKYDPYTPPRVLSPLLILLAVRGIKTKSLLWAAPLGMMAARVVLQLGPQVLGIVRSLAS